MTSARAQETPQARVARLVTEAAELAGRAGSAAVAALVAEVEGGSVPGRGTVESSALRLASGVLAERLLARDPGPAPLPPRPVRAPLRGTLVLGPPLAAAATRAANGLSDLPPRRPTRVVVLARPLDEAIADVWASRVWAGVNCPWAGQTATLNARDVIPPQTNALGIAGRWVRRVGARNIDIVTTTGEVTGVTRRPLHVVHPAVAAPVTEMARSTSVYLGILTDPETHVRVLREVLRPLVAGFEGPGPRVRPALVPWMERHADRLVHGLSHGGYSLHGEANAVRPRGAGTVVWPGSDGQQPAVLDVAVRTLLATCEETP